MIKMYSIVKTRETIIEVWGGSTKHPDLKRTVVHDNPYFNNPAIDTIQTLLLMGSETLFPIHVAEYVREAMKWLEVLNYDFKM